MTPTNNQPAPVATPEAAPPRPDLIASRKTCDAQGTGLSHYVLMDRQARR